MDSTPFPSPLLRWGAFAARWAFRLMVLVWLALVLVWGGLHFMIVPRIADFRPWLQQQASAALGRPVQIENLTAQSTGFAPVITLMGVVVLDAEGAVAVRVPKLQIGVSPQSLLTLGLEQFVVDRPEIVLRRTAADTLEVAGVRVNLNQDSQSSKWLDWFFAQPEWLVQDATLHWTDVYQQRPTFTVQVGLLLQRNRGLTHSVLVQGDSWNMQAEFKEPLLGLNRGDWQRWKGTVFAQASEVDLAQWSQVVSVADIQSLQGHGSTRIWLEVEEGDLQSVTSDVALQDVRIQSQADLEPIAMHFVQGRWGLNVRKSGMEYFTESLQFETTDGLRWPGGNVQLKTFSASRSRPAGGALVAHSLDIAAISQIAQRLPLEPRWLANLKQWSPQGQVQRLQADWVGSLEQMQRYRIQGRVEALALASQRADAAREATSPTGIQGLNADFDVSQDAGNVQVSMQQGQLDSMGWLEPSVIPVDALQMTLQWERNQRGWDVQVPKIVFRNGDLQGQWAMRWRNDQAHRAEGDGTFDKGKMELQGTLTRVHLPALPRYLPYAVMPETVTYLRQAIQVGQASQVQFNVSGDVARFPFSPANPGTFDISAELSDVDFVFAPTPLLSAGSLPWQTLRKTRAQLFIKQDALQVRNASGILTGGAELAFSNTQASVTDWYQQPKLTVQAQMRGPLNQGLRLANQSPLRGITAEVLSQATATGNADYRFALALPLDRPEQATVQGQIDFAGNDIQLQPDTPRLNQVRGALLFTQSGISTKNLQAWVLGGDIRVQGGLDFAATARGVKAQEGLRIQGTLNAAGLRQFPNHQTLARLAQFASGSTPFSAFLGWRDGQLEWSFQSSLQGMALALPAPLAKSAETSMPLRLENALYHEPGRAALTGQRLDRIALTIENRVSLVYVRDVTEPTARVLRGAIGVGLAQDESAPLPAQGVMGNIQMAQLNLDAWSKVLAALQPTALGSHQSEDDRYLAYLPTTLAVRAEEVLLDDRKLHRLVIGGTREGRLWRANLDAKELNGYIEYQESTAQQAGKVYARLARLMVAASEAQAVESLLDEQPQSIPALDIVVQSFELRGKNLGRLEIDAINRGAQRDQVPEWRLNRLNLTMPEARFDAVGNWSSVQALPSVTRKVMRGAEQRRTVLNFVLTLDDTGGLLSRLGTPGVIRKGAGKVEGQVAWMGSPLTLHYPSLNGKLAVNVEKGQFLKAEPGIAKLVGVLSLQALPRRLTLDFKDVFSEGFSFDFLRGDVAIEAGIARTNNLQMKGVNAAVLMEGQADIAKETQSIKVVVIPEINAGTASLIATAINPMIGVSTFVAQWLLRRPLASVTTQQFVIEGSWLDPKVSRMESP
jgi:uncharacterized protein (TIGR02099 family)